MASAEELGLMRPAAAELEAAALRVEAAQCELREASLAAAAAHQRVESALQTLTLVSEAAHSLLMRYHTITPPEKIN